MKQIGFLFLISFLGVASRAEAQIITAPETLQSANDLLVLIENLTDWMFAIFLVLATIFILFAGFQYLTAQADPAQISNARYKVIIALIAIMVAVMAKGIPTIMRSIIVGQ